MIQIQNFFLKEILHILTHIHEDHNAHPKGKNILEKDLLIEGPSLQNHLKYYNIICIEGITIRNS